MAMPAPNVSRLNRKTKLQAIDINSLTKIGRPKDPDLEQKRKSEILESAAIVFADAGFANADVQVIADRINISKGTIYRYFTTKEELFLSTVDRAIQSLNDEIDRFLEDETLDPLQAISTAILTYLKFFSQRPEVTELFTQERAIFRDRRTPILFLFQKEKNQRDRKYVKKLVDQGILRNIDIAKTIDLLRDLLYGTILSNHLGARRVKPEVQAKLIIDTIFLGVLSENGRKKIMKGMKSS